MSLMFIPLEEPVIQVFKTIVELERNNKYTYLQTHAFRIQRRKSCSYLGYKKFLWSSWYPSKR